MAPGRQWRRAPRWVAWSGPGRGRFSLASSVTAWRRQRSLRSVPQEATEAAVTTSEERLLAWGGWFSGLNQSESGHKQNVAVENAGRETGGGERLVAQDGVVEVFLAV